MRGAYRVGVGPGGGPNRRLALWGGGWTLVEGRVLELKGISEPCEVLTFASKGGQRAR
jgi:hypothetical protein